MQPASWKFFEVLETLSNIHKHTNLYAIEAACSGVEPATLVTQTQFTLHSTNLNC